MIKLWTIGREREKAHAAKFVRKPDQQALLFPVIDAVHDLKEGVAPLSHLIDCARVAMLQGHADVWYSTAYWLEKLVNQLPAVGALWIELADHGSWRVRSHVARDLYHNIPEGLSDRLFAKLRSDPSAKVREIAIDRYENRSPGPRQSIEKIFDAAGFDERVRNGEVTL